MRANVCIGVSGGIAAYKVPGLVRLFTKGGYAVKTVMTKHGEHFVTPLVLRALSNNPVVTDQFETPEAWDMEHISLARWMDLLLVCPATANIIGKFAGGIADDFLSTLFLSTESPVLVCPAMNSSMYSNRAVSRNMEMLARRGVEVMSPDSGSLACGEEGPGRMPDPERILKKAEEMLGSSDGMDGLGVLVTAGPTCEDLDPVRYLTSRSSGRMGYALAAEAARRGARVMLVSGPAELADPPGAEVVRVRTALEMRDAVYKKIENVDILIMAAAVADYRPEKRSEGKIAKGGDMNIKLVRNPDILEEIGGRKKKPFLVGFAAETSDLKARALDKLHRKNLDIIAVNDVSREDSGFRSDYNELAVYTGNGGEYSIPRSTKDRAASKLMDIMIENLK